MTPLPHSRRLQFPVALCSHFAFRPPARPAARRAWGRIAAWIYVVALGSGWQACVWSAEPVDFARDILPLLSDRCFVCHGPDANQRATDLRLDQEASAHGTAIVPGSADQSELIRRILSRDADVMMPPPDSNLKLSVEEQQLLRRWIDAGGQYSAHWAFVPPVQPELPPISQENWPRNAIDYFILSRLDKEQLSPSPEADAETLIRRVTLDLTGLPPTPQEIDAFAAQTQATPELAYEQLVDRLMASASFGERMAVDWLDVARYADTYGYQNDRYRAMWPWRDWVVQALNQNLSYAEFIRWQIAGDLLPAATREQILATAFNRNHRQTNEGGSVEEEFRAEYVADRVNTFGAAFLGLTLECCRCHDHKYDPLTQREYYQLSAFFNSIDESGLYSHFTEATPTPTLLLTNSTEERELADIRAAIEVRQRELGQWKPAMTDFAQWRSRLSDIATQPESSARVPVETDTPRPKLRDVVEASLREALIGDFPLDSIDGGKVQNRVDPTDLGQASEDPQLCVGRVGQGLLLSGENNVSFKPGGDFTRNQPFTLSLWLKAPRFFQRAVVLHRSRAWTDSGSRGYELLIEDGKLSAGLIHFWPGNALRILARDLLPVEQWVHVSLRYDGSSQAAGLQLFVNGQLQPAEIVRDNLTKHISGADGVGGGDVRELTLGQRFRDIGFKDGQVDELKVFQRDLSQLELSFLYLAEADPEHLEAALREVTADDLHDYFSRLHPVRSQLAAELRSLRDRRSQLLDSIAEIMVMREQPTPRPTYVLVRGAYDAPAEEVGRGVPQSILGRSLPAGANRLDLAEWLVDPQHPLSSRVAVNRFWQSLFGEGLVSTAEDFGLQGAAPSHPELLDWLSAEFVRSGWDVKRLLKWIVTSSTYRQRSDPNQMLLAHDPTNRWLARGPAVRLPAEMIRDAALMASGLLETTVGGPPVKPYQPEGLWEEKAGVSYVRDEHSGSHRRSLYTYWKRTSPPPNMMTLDASNREVCVVRRQVTLTPLQILVLLNDPQYVEAARGLAERSLSSQHTPLACAEFIYRSLTGQRPTAEQVDILLTMFAQQRRLFEGDAAAVKGWLSIGDHQPQANLNPIDLAAWSVVAGGLMSLDETVMKR
jgi:hypothetical protein